jgi:hypothetical protein
LTTDKILKNVGTVKCFSEPSPWFKKGMIKMTKVTMCQSCGLPFNEEHAHFVATEPDGSKSIYCTNCYKKGKFIDPNLSMEQMIEMLVPVLGKAMGEENARKELTTLLPTLERWKKA